MEVSEQIEKFKEFIDLNYKEDLQELIRKDKKSIIFDFNLLSKFDPELSELILQEPEEIIKAAELSLENFDVPPDLNMQVRIKNLPPTQEFRIRDIRSKNINKLISFEAIVRQASDVRPQVTSAKFECPSCGNTISMLQLESKFREPSRCSCGRKGKFRLISKELVDAQHLKVEEAPEALEGGEQPKRISIFLKDDLVDPRMERHTTPGSKIRIVGILKEIPIQLTAGGQSTRFDLAIDTNFIEPAEEDFSEINISKEDEEFIKELAKDPRIYEKLAASIAPSIYGHEEIKEALVLQLVGGVKKERPDGTRTRGDMHILLVGDPGSGKSQLLQFISKCAPKARFISGKGASATGLTASVVKDEFLRGWALEAGALVLANKGIACLTPDTKIISNDKIMPIKELFDEKKKVLMKSNNEIVEINNINFKVPSITNELLVENKNTTLIRRKLYKGKIKKILFDSGFEITLTPEHKLLDGNSLEWKDSSSFKKGDHVISPLKIPNNNNNTRYLDVINNWELREGLFIKGRSKERIKTEYISPEMAYLIGFVLGDGNVSISKRRTRIEIKQSKKHKDYIDKVKYCFKKVFNKDINSYSKIFKSNIRGKDTESDCEVMYFGSKFFAEVYFYFIKNNLRNILTLNDDCLKSFIAGVLDSDGCISTKGYKKNNKNYNIQHIEFFFSNSKEMNLNFTLALRRFDCYAKIFDTKNNVLGIRLTGFKDVAALKDNLRGISLKVDKAKILIRKTNVSSASDKLPSIIVSKICSEISKLNKTNLLKNGIWSNIYDYKNMKRQPSRDQLQKILLRTENYNQYNFLLNRDYFLDKIKEIKEEDYEGYVYDLFVPETNNFVANGIIVHNCLDELDKISVEDSSSLHEALEQQTVTISKANIQATLRAETTVLAAANPKFGRFDPYAPIASQINMPPTLINRFDLIFPIRDIPNTERDTKIALHVLELQKKADSFVAEIPPNKLRKYISYVKQKVSPKLTDGAIQDIKSFYVSLRNSPQQGDESIKPIPISARQLEALVRLSEAVAKIRLSDKVTVKDTKRAITLLKHCLMQVGFDPETGKMDIDRISGIPASVRGKIVTIKEIINQLEQKVGKQIPVEDIIVEATDRGIKEEDIKEAIEKLKRSGDVFEPRNGFISRI